MSDFRKDAAFWRYRYELLLHKHEPQTEAYHQLRRELADCRKRLDYLEHLNALTEEFSHREAGELRRSVEAFKALKKDTQALREENRRLRKELKESRKQEVSEKVVWMLHNMTAEITVLKDQVRTGNQLVETLTDKVDTLTAENTALAATNRNLRDRFHIVPKEA